MGSIVRIAAYTAMATVGLLGLKKEGVVDFDFKKVVDLFK